ncbi:hypothetical protein BC831DRAFT_415257 [Entophlyctis helioformis]|nr:hypothetical protein BC831DRAFT_415257 [Entophlyctis helioformis]
MHRAPTNATRSDPTQSASQVGGMLAGGLLGAAGLAGAVAYGVTSHGDHKDHVDEANWTQQNWEQDARRRFDAYQNALRAGQPMPAVHWVLAQKGQIPQNAIPAGSERDGKPIYAIRTWHENSLQVGKMVPGWNGASLSYGGKEYSGYPIYEVLVGNPNAVRWVDISGHFNAKAIPGQLIEAGHEHNRDAIFIAQTQHEGSVQVGKVTIGNEAHIGYGGREYSKNAYRVLCFA